MLFFIITDAFLLVQIIITMIQEFASLVSVIVNIVLDLTLINVFKIALGIKDFIKVSVLTPVPLVPIIIVLQKFVLIVIMSVKLATVLLPILVILVRQDYYWKIIIVNHNALRIIF
jgi:hypothetical protein